MDAVTRTRIMALIRHVRTRMHASLEICPGDLAARFRLDAFVVERLVEEELGRGRLQPRVAPGATRDTREMAPAPGSSLPD